MTSLNRCMTIPNIGIMSKLSLYQFKGKWHQIFNEKQAMEALKKKVSEERNPSADFLSILINCFNRYDSDPSRFGYTYIIKYLLNKRLFSRLPPILDNLEKIEKFEISEALFVNLIRGYGKANMFEDAVNIFFRIPKFSCTPSAVSLNSLLFVLCKKKEGLVLVQDVLMKSLEMNIRLELSSFWILIRALCRNGRVDYAIELFNIMQMSHEYMPDSRMYSLILCSLCKQATSIEVVNFLEDMLDAGFTPNISEYTSVINILVREGKANDAYVILTKMKIGGLKPDMMIYTTVLDGIFLANDFHKADSLFDEMLLMGIVPNIFTYNVYINGLCKQGDLERAYRMVICMERAGCKPDVDTFNMLIAGYSKSGALGKARDVMNEMLERGLQWNVHTYRPLIDGLIREGKIAEACKIFRGILSKGFAPAPSTYHALICGLCINDLLNEAMQVLEETINRSIAPDASSWEALLLGFKLSSQEALVHLEDITDPSTW